LIDTKPVGASGAAIRLAREWRHEFKKDTGNAHRQTPRKKTPIEPI